MFKKVAGAINASHKKGSLTNRQQHMMSSFFAVVVQCNIIVSYLPSDSINKVSAAIECGIKKMAEIAECKSQKTRVKSIACGVSADTRQHHFTVFKKVAVHKTIEILT